MNNNKTILVTGAAGFIGYHLSKKLLGQGHQVIGLDNINGYYSVQLKLDRLKQLGINEVAEGGLVSSNTYGEQFQFIKLDLENRNELPKLFQQFQFDVVCNLAAQAGVRYSIENPNVYIDANIVGFVNLLECMRHANVKKLVYASSSSVYGMNEKIPFETTDRVDHPISLYAATHKVKRIKVKPKGRLSYQYHHKRSEVWTIVSGTGRITLDGETQDYNPGEVIQIPQGMKHRIENPSETKDCMFIEVQLGTYFGEDDIVRIQDDYERI